MTELLKGLVHVRDALSLIAFLGLVLLLAFRTQKVPELLFGLVRDKLTRQQFSVLINRFMTLGLIAFLALVLLATLAQVLNYLTQPGSLTINDLRRELSRFDSPEKQKVQAEAQYRLAMARLAQRDFDAAIAALEKSIKAIPTLTAQEMVSHLYRLKGDFEGEAEAWKRAVTTARQNGDRLALIRLDRLGTDRSHLEAEGPHDLIGDKTSLPNGGEELENAPEIQPGLYNCSVDGGCFSWGKLRLKTGESLLVKFRSPPTGNLAGVGLYGTNGQFLTQAGDQPGTMRGNAGPRSTIYKTDWTALHDGWHFLRFNADKGTAVRIYVR